MADDAMLLKRVQYLCTEYDCGRGLWKRIDENRETLAALKYYAPNLLKQFGFFEIWLGNQDIFLVNLLRLMELPEHKADFGPCFPMKWPGIPAINSAYMWFTPEIRKSLGLSDGGTSTGKDTAQ